MNCAIAQKKTLVSGATLPGQLNAHVKKGSPYMDITTHNLTAQIIKRPSLLLPNEAQFRLPVSVKHISREHGIAQSHAKLVAEIQGYDLGGA